LTSYLIYAILSPRRPPRAAAGPHDASGDKDQAGEGLQCDAGLGPAATKEGRMPLFFKRTLDEADLDQLRRLTAAGVPNKEIAARMRATRHAVADAQRRLGIYRRRWREFPELTPEEIERRAAEIRREWTPEVAARRRVGGPGEWSPTAVPVSVRRLILY